MGLLKLRTSLTGLLNIRTSLTELLKLRISLHFLPAEKTICPDKTICTAETLLSTNCPPLSYKTALAVQTADIVLQYTEYIVNRSDPTHMKLQFSLTK